MLRFLLDTNIISNPNKPGPDPIVQRRMRQHQDEVAISATVWYELMHGWAFMQDGKAKQALGRYLDGVRRVTPILPYDRRAARWCAEEWARLGHKKTPPALDAEIAAVAAVHQLVMVTDNVKHFRDFSDLEVINWMS
jgi:tRNA(fMet)-specific endonuclease VapC